MSTIQSLRTRAASCSRFLLAVGLAVGAGAIAAACGGDELAAPPLLGSIQVTVATTGSELDPDGYAVTADGGASKPVGVDGSVTFSGLQPGDHVVALEDVAANCTVPVGNSQTVTVIAGQTLGAVFTVTCIGTSGDLEIAAVTTGNDLDPDGYSVSVDAGPGQALGTNGTITTTTAAGDHIVELSGVANNCVVNGDNPRTVSVPPSGMVQTTFVIECTSVTGALVLTALTSGADLDADGYFASLNGGVDQPIGINGTITLTSVAAGQRTVQLSGVANNCVVNGDNPRTVTVPAGGTVQTIFVVVCTSLTGSVQVTTVTTGSDFDPDGYTVLVDGGPGQAIDVNATLTIPGVEPGARSVQLGNLEGNCAVMGDNPQTVTVAAAATVQTTFLVECSPLTGSLVVTTVTTGNDPDPDGYTVLVDGGPGQVIGVNATLTIPGVEPGDRSVQLGGLAINCRIRVGDDNPRTVTVIANQTASTTFRVTCATLISNQIVFDSDRDGTDSDIYVMNPDGSDVVRLTTDPAEDVQPAVSPDGLKVTFVRELAGPNREIFVMDADGSNQTRLTFDAGLDRNPAWSPDGTKIAFVSDRDGDREIWVMDADGGNLVQLTFNAVSEGFPAWSPDGSQILVGSDGDISVMPASGGIPQQLPTAASGFDPSWSPDGTKIAFTTDRDGNFEIYVMNADGSSPMNLTNNAAQEFSASWSPDGTKIAFTTDRDGNFEIYVVNADGSSPTNRTNDPANDFELHWSR